MFKPMPYPAPPSAAFITLVMLTLSAWVGPSHAESWMNERQRAASVQRSQERLADQARRPNAPSNGMVANPEALCRVLGGTACSGADAAREARQAQEAALRREAGEAEQRRAQRRTELERRFREIDAAASAEADRLRARAMARVAAAQPFLKAGPQPGHVAEYCEAISVFSDEFGAAGAPNPALAVLSYQAAVTVDESQDNCWQGYARVARLLMAADTVSSRFRYDFAPLHMAGVSNAEAGRRIQSQYESWREGMLTRRAVVETFVNPAARMPSTRPLQPPAQWADWDALSRADEPEAFYWRSRAHLLGQFGQPKNPAAAQAAACDPKAVGYFRNRLNCWWFQHAQPQSDGLADLVALMLTVREPRDPKLYQGKPELAQIMARRSEAAAAAAMYANQAMAMAISVELGAMPPPNSNLTPAQAAQQLARMACGQYEAAVALGYYDNDHVAFNLVSCYEQDHLRAPEGARSQLFAALEADGNPSYKRWLSGQFLALNTQAAEAAAGASSPGSR